MNGRERGNFPGGNGNKEAKQPDGELLSTAIKQVYGNKKSGIDCSSNALLPYWIADFPGLDDCHWGRLLCYCLHPEQARIGLLHHGNLPA